MSKVLLINRGDASRILLRMCFILVILGVGGTVKGQDDQGINKVDSLREVLMDGGHTDLERALLHHKVGYFLAQESRFEETLVEWQKALTLYTIANDQENLMALFNDIGTIYYYLDFNVEAIYWYQGAECIAEELGNDSARFEYLGGKGYIHLELKQMESAQQAFEEAQQLDVYDTLLSYQMECHLGALKTEQDSIELAEKHFEQALSYIENQNRPLRKAIALIYLGSCRAQLGKFDEALRGMEEADSILDSIPWSFYRISSVLTRGYIWGKEGNQDSVSIYTNRGIQMAREIGFTAGMEYGFRTLMEAAEERNDWEGAVNWADSLIEGKRKQNAEMYSSGLNKIDLLYNIRKSYAESMTEVKLLKQESQIVNLQVVVAIGFIILLALAIGFLVFKQKTRGRLRVQEMENSQLIRQQLKDELEFKNKELTQFATYIVNKKHFVQLLLSKLEDLEENPKQSLDSVRLLIKKNLNSDQDLQEFDLRVRQENEAFFYELGKRYPNLSEKERRLAVLVFLNVGSKEIAEILHISVSGVEKSRHRLRKKLGMQQGENLRGFLQSL